MQNDVIKPAVYGTLNVLRTCTKAKTVKRVVVTSSMAAACVNESVEQNQYIDENCWTDVDFLRAKEPAGWVERKIIKCFKILAIVVVGDVVEWL